MERWDASLAGGVKMPIWQLESWLHVKIPKAHAAQVAQVAVSKFCLGWKTDLGGQRNKLARFGALWSKLIQTFQLPWHEKLLKRPLASWEAKMKSVAVFDLMNTQRQCVARHGIMVQMVLVLRSFASWILARWHEKSARQFSRAFDIVEPLLWRLRPQLCKVQPKACRVRQLLQCLLHRTWKWKSCNGQAQTPFLEVCRSAVAGCCDMLPEWDKVGKEWNSE